jgi:hypothetical protein
MALKWIAAGLVFVAGVASAQTMNAEQFHRRATALQKKGAMAVFSGGEIRSLMREGQAAAKKASEQRRADVSAGRKARFCPPTAKGSMGSNEFMQRLTAIPAAERARIDMTEATTRILASKYPCAA